MKKILVLAIISLFTPLLTLATIREIEQAIMDSRPEKLDQLLKETSLSQPQLKSCVILASEVYRMKKSQADSSFSRENPKPGETLTIMGTIAFSLGLGMSFAVALDKFAGPTPSASWSINYPYALINSALFLSSLSFFYGGYKKNQKPGWRSKKDEYLDAFRVGQYLSNLAT